MNSFLFFHSIVGGLLCAFEQYGEWKLMLFILMWGRREDMGFGHWSLDPNDVSSISCNAGTASGCSFHAKQWVEVLLLS